MTTESEPAKEPDSPVASSPSLKQTIAATLVVTVIAAAMGALFEVPPPPLEASPKDAAASSQRAPASAGVVDLPPVVTNLGAPQDTWVRLEASILYDAKALPNPEAIAGEIAGDELAYLRTVTLKQIEGPIGLENIRQDLNERASIRSEGKVTELIIRTLVVQ
jgi:flagellar FliL protein